MLSSKLCMSTRQCSPLQGEVGGDPDRSFTHMFYSQFPCTILA